MLTVAHITDVHLPADPKVMERFVKCLKEVKTKKVDFFLNTGDSIMAVDRDNSTRRRSMISGMLGIAVSKKLQIMICTVV